jgi:hypothetical protein
MVKCINMRAIILDASEIYVDLPNQGYFNFHAHGFTVSAWVKTEQSGWAAIVSKGDRKEPRSGWELEHNGDSAVITLRSPTGVSNNATFGGVELTDNEWHMLVGTYDEQTGLLALYVDGEKRSEAGPFWALSETDMALKIGTELSSDDPDLEDTNPFTGWIDDVKILSYAQDAYEIAIEYTDIVEDSSICVEPVEGDLNGDCEINTGDLVEIVLDWLKCGLVPSSACD